YSINSPGFTPSTNNQMKVHRSRIIEFRGRQVPRQMKTVESDIEAKYWGISEITPIFSYLSQFSAGMTNVGSLLYELVIGKYKFADLDEILAQGNEGLLRTRMSAIDEGKSVIHAV